METQASASTGDNRNFALEAKDGAEVLELDVYFGRHSDVRG